VDIVLAMSLYDRYLLEGTCCFLRIEARSSYPKFMERNHAKILDLIMDRMSFLKVEPYEELRNSIDSSSAQNSIDQQLSEIEREIRHIEETELSYFKKESKITKDQSFPIDHISDQVKFSTYPATTLATIVESVEEGTNGLPLSRPIKMRQPRPVSVPAKLDSLSTMSNTPDFPISNGDGYSQQSPWDSKRPHSLSTPRIRPHEQKTTVSFVKENRLISVSYEIDSDCSESDSAAWD
jgi:hypothetical protein